MPIILIINLVEYVHTAKIFTSAARCISPVSVSVAWNTAMMMVGLMAFVKVKKTQINVMQNIVVLKLCYESPLCV